MSACCFKQPSLRHFVMTAPVSPSRQTWERRGLDASLSSQNLTLLLSAGVASCLLLHLFPALSFLSHLIQPELQAANETEGQTSIVKWDLASILLEHPFLRYPARRPLLISGRHIPEGRISRCWQATGTSASKASAQVTARALPRPLFVATR